jgi:hypothetical protein
LNFKIYFLESGEVFGIGDNRNHRLSFENCLSVDSLTKLNFLKIKEVECGQSHSIVISGELNLESFHQRLKSALYGHQFDDCKIIFEIKL